jgi:hypothetical protein
MSAFLFLTSSWRSGGTGHLTVAQTRAASALAQERATPAAARPAPDGTTRRRPDDVDRPILRRARRFRNDGVLGLRWLS